VACLWCFEKLSLDAHVALVDGRLSSGAFSNPALLKLDGRLSSGAFSNPALLKLRESFSSVQR
jgi:hypothetical protein